MKRQIKPINNHGNIQLKWTFQGRRYTLHPIPGAQYSDPLDLAKVEALAQQIALDIRRECFDTTLERYRPTPVIHSTASPPEVKPVSLIELWDAWVETLGLSEETKACHYEHTRRMMVKVKPTPQVVDDATWFISASAKLAASTHNIRLRALRKCYEWAVEESKATGNPYKKVKTRALRKVKVKPFTTPEIDRILEDFREHNPTYTAFITFLFMTGCRTSEAIGLQWKRIDFARGELTIEDHMPISAVTGKPHRKTTKTNTVTIINLTDELRALLETLKPMAGVCGEALVFTSLDDKVINRRNFRGRVWKPTLERLGIAYRKPYTTRHTMDSHAIEQGIPLTGVAYLLGHRDTQMVSRTYGHMVNRPTLPNLKLG